jgi:hypothetical protein
MTDREKLIELLKAADRYEFEETRNSGVYDREAAWGYIADHLLANDVTFTPAIPGPSEADPNIMELCFHNGERNMKEKIASVMLDRKKMFPCEADVIDCILNMLEGL